MLSSPRQSRHFGMENLESRRLFAADMALAAVDSAVIQQEELALEAGGELVVMAVDRSLADAGQSNGEKAQATASRFAVSPAASARSELQARRVSAVDAALAAADSEVIRHEELALEAGGELVVMAIDRSLVNAGQSDGVQAQATAGQLADMILTRFSSNHPTIHGGKPLTLQDDPFFFMPEFGEGRF